MGRVSFHDQSRRLRAPHGGEIDHGAAGSGHPIIQLVDTTAD
jgi:hypothetical protein